MSQGSVRAQDTLSAENVSGILLRHILKVERFKANHAVER